MSVEVLVETIVSSGFDFRPVNNGDSFVIPVKAEWLGDNVEDDVLPQVDDINKVRRFIERLGDDGFDFNFEEYTREIDDRCVVTVFHIKPLG